MPKLLVPRPEWTDQVQVPADGDLADESSLRTPFQQIANAARWLRDAISFQGVLAIRGVPDLAALKAIVPVVSGQVAYVYGRGIYVYLEGATPNEDAPWIVAPRTGAGRWYHPLANLLAGPRSFVTTTAENKLARELVPNGLVGVFVENQSGSMPAMTSTPVEVVGFALKPPDARAGDVFYVDWTGKLRPVQSGSWGGFFPVVTDGGQDYQLNLLEVRITAHPNGQNTSFHVGTVWTARTPGVAFKARVSSGGGDVFLDGGQIRCLQVRP